MNKFRIIAGSIILAVAMAAVVAWQHGGKAGQLNAGLTAAATSSAANAPKVIVPARVIPADVNQNMQAALVLFSKLRS